MVEYNEAYEDGIIVEVAEFQDGSAFVWRSEQIINTISPDEYDAHELEEILEYLEISRELMNDISTPEMVEASLFRVIYEITGHESSSDNLDEYFENIYELLDDVVKYHEINPDLAVKAAAVAYIDNYEFIEGPLDSVDSILMEDIEKLLRKDLRSMLQENAPKDEIIIMLIPLHLIKLCSNSLESAETIQEYIILSPKTNRGHLLDAPYGETIQEYIILSPKEQYQSV